MNDDFFVSMINAYHKRYFFKDRRFCLISKKGTFTNTGGTANVRTLEREKQDVITLKKLFGSVVDFKKTKGVNATHPYQRQVKQHKTNFRR